VRGVNSDSATGGKPMGSRTHMWHAGLDCSALLLSTAGGHTHTHTSCCTTASGFLQLLLQEPCPRHDHHVVDMPTCQPQNMMF
jgi:hypothetical protein